MDKASAPKPVMDLVERFANHADYYCSGRYKETDLRNEFLDPFFEALGWDVYNKKGYDPSHRQVVRETRLMVEGSSRAPDYSFRTGSQPEFFVEAKHPGHNLDKDPKPAFQLRRYAWNAGLPVSILTDFDEFCVFNSMLRPRETTYGLRLTAYGSRPGHPEAVSRRPSAVGRQPSDIERWRILLARNIALRNKGIKELADLNYVVQATIDRIVFLRICEDRGIEAGDQLKSLLGSDGIYRLLFRRFQQADERYNSGLFYFTQEKARRERVDEISARLKIDDAPLKEIISGLYPPKSPYEFSVMPADVLGQVYERFLGSVIHLTEGHQARIKEKPEVRKAGGLDLTDRMPRLLRAQEEE